MTHFCRAVLGDFAPAADAHRQADYHATSVTDPSLSTFHFLLSNNPFNANTGIGLAFPLSGIAPRD